MQVRQRFGVTAGSPEAGPRVGPHPPRAGRAGRDGAAACPAARLPRGRCLRQGQGAQNGAARPRGHFCGSVPGEGPPRQPFWQRVERGPARRKPAAADPQPVPPRVEQHHGLGRQAMPQRIEPADPDGRDAKGQGQPRAAATEIRTPVKFPGPIPTPIPARPRQATPAPASICSSIGISASACPLSIGSTWQASRRVPHNKAAAQCAADVSKARTMGQAATGRTSTTSGYSAAAGSRCPSSASAWTRGNQRRRPACADRPRPGRTRGR